MAIIYHLFYNGEDGRAIKFAKEMEESGIAEKIRAEKGNLRYEYYQSLASPNILLLIDSWESQEALDKHHASPMMKKIIKLREKYDLHMESERLIAEGENPEDSAFIRK